jgi:hypothetical protein
MTVGLDPEVAEPKNKKPDPPIESWHFQEFL